MTGLSWKALKNAQVLSKTNDLIIFLFFFFYFLAYMEILVSISS